MTIINTTIYTTFDKLPASKIAQEELEQLKTIYNLAYAQIKAKLELAEEKFKLEREEKRKLAKFTYSVTSEDKEDGKYYTIKRTADNPLEGDTNFYEDRIYTSFRIINNVFIRSESGYIIFKTGEIVNDDEIELLDSGEVPMRLIETKACF